MAFIEPSPLIFFPCCCCFWLPLAIFWVWMLVDCLVNEPSEGNDKIVWVLVIVFTGWIGALIYLLARRPTRKAKFGR
jgi:hypothetical protein